MNIGELKELIKDLPDELRVATIDSEIGVVDAVATHEKHVDVSWGLDKLLIKPINL